MTHTQAGSSAGVSSVLGSFNVTNVTVTSSPVVFQNGWGDLTFTGVQATGTIGMAGAAASSDRSPVGTDVIAIAAGTAGAVTFFGLPVTGFMVRTLRNNNQFPCLTTAATPTCAQAYMSLFNHSYRTRINP
jgi:hypothetical protein